VQTVDAQVRIESFAAKKKEPLPGIKSG